MRRLLAIIIPLFGLLLITPLAFAQTNQGLNLTTSPIVVNLVAKPGSTTYTDLRVHNNGTVSQHIQVGLLKFTAGGTTGKPVLLPKGPGDDYFNWVKFTDTDKHPLTTLSLGVGEWKTIRATFTIPKTAAFGYYYAVTFTQGNAAQNVNEAITGASAILVLLDVQTPNEKKALQVVKFSTDKSIYEFLPVNFTVTVKNIGNIHTVPQGDVFIAKGSDSANQLAVLSLNQSQGNILPSTSRDFPVQWNDGFPVNAPKVEHGQVVKDSKGTVQTTLQWDFSQASKVRVGKYTAKLLLVYNDGTRDVPLEGTVSFWVIPWRVIAGVVVVGLIALFGVYAILRAIVRSVKR